MNKSSRISPSIYEQERTKLQNFNMNCATVYPVEDGRVKVRPSRVTMIVISAAVELL